MGRIPAICAKFRLDRVRRRRITAALPRRGAVRRPSPLRSMADARPLLRRAALSLTLATTSVLWAPVNVSAQNKPQPVDLIITGARIYTVDAARPTVAAFAVSGGKIVFAGSEAEALALKGPSTRVLDYTGRADHCRDGRRRRLVTVGLAPALRGPRRTPRRHRAEERIHEGPLRLGTLARVLRPDRRLPAPPEHPQRRDARDRRAAASTSPRWNGRR